MNTGLLFDDHVKTKLYLYQSCSIATQNFIWYLHDSYSVSIDNSSICTECLLNKFSIIMSYLHNISAVRMIEWLCANFSINIQGLFESDSVIIESRIEASSISIR